MFDNGRLKTASFNTDQGFGLRAVAGEAAATPIPAIFLKPRCCARPMPSRPSRVAIPARSPRRPPAPTAISIATKTRIPSPSFEAKAKLLQEIDAWLRAKDPGAAGDGFARRLLAACRDRARRRPMVRDIVRWCGSTSRWWSAMATARRAAPTASAGARLRRIPGRGQLEACGANEALRQALVNLEAIAGAGRHVRRGARPRLAGRHAARGGRPRAGRRFQPQEDLGLRRPDRPAGGVDGRHRRRRRHDAERRGSLTIDDEGTPPAATC